MECGNNLELKAEVENYVTIDKQISDLIERKLATSATYYTLHSLTGGMPLSKSESIYHRAETTENIIMHILEKEAVIQRKIDTLRHKQALFVQCMGGEVMGRLEQDLTSYGVTELVYQAYEAIGEVEYYLKQHKQAINPIKVVFDEEESQQMNEIGATFLTRIKELSL